MTEGDPLFTVVVPTHGGRPSVRTAVGSVLKQTRPDFELIVVSDGEATRTRQLLEDVSDSRLRIEEQVRTGVSAARNLGVSHGTAPWLAFLDDDDTVKPGWLDHWASLIAPDAAGVTARISINSEGAPTRVWVCRLAIDDPTMGASTILPGGFAIRREVFEAVGGFDEGLAYSENQDLGLRVCDYLGSQRRDLRIVDSQRIVADFNRESATPRMQRYRSAPGLAAEVFLTRYASRLKGDRTAAAALYRIASRAHRVEGRRTSSVKAALHAVRLEATRLENWRSLLLALAPKGILSQTRPVSQNSNR